MQTSERLAGHVGVLVRRWERLDRGWQATVLGLALLAAQVLVQAA